MSEPRSSISPDTKQSRSARWAACILAASLLLAACGSSDSPDPTNPATAAPTTTSAPVVIDCDQPTPLLPVAQILDAAPEACRQWIDGTYGRVVNATTGSATIWSRRTEHGTALLVGAVHTLGLGWLGAADTPVAESLVSPEDTTGIARLFLVRPDGSGLDDLASPWFALYNPAIAAERNNNLLNDLLPSEDFYVAVTDSQKLDVSGLPPVVEPLVRGQVPIYDPIGVTTSGSTWAPGVENELSLLVGYPNETGELTASVGRILSDAAADQAIAELAERGDVEGDIAYNAEVEIILEGKAVAGMSGGAAFDRDGRLVGILVRASDEHEGAQYVRAVRMSWVVQRLDAAFDGLDSAAQAAIAGFTEVGS